MKRVLLLRHGKSDWDADYSGDHARPLAPRGVQASRRMGELISRAGLEPDRILSSSAVRALRTAELAATAGKWAAPVQAVPSLYHASPGSVFRLLQELDESVGIVLVAGHEPTMSGLVVEMTGALCRYPTAAVANIELRSDSWSDAGPDSGELVWFVTPKLVARGLGFDD